MSDLTRVLERLQQGEGTASEELLLLVYEELRKLAAHKMCKEAPSQALQPAALVHEARLRLVGGGRQQRNSRGHFFAAAAEAMRRILVENARRKRARSFSHSADATQSAAASVNRPAAAADAAAHAARTTPQNDHP